jgi:protein-tyrosine-phosphatase
MIFPYKSILIACSVNTARSRMAEGYLKKIFKDNLRINSCGVASNARDDMLISLDARLAMKEEGIILPEDSKSRDLKKHINLLKESDLVLTLTEDHKKIVKNLIKANQFKGIEIFTMREFAGKEGDIEDPSMKELEGFRKARDEIKFCIREGLKKYNIKLNV